MSPRDKAILDRCYQKCVKNTKVKKDNKQIATAIKAKTSAPQASCEATATPVKIVDQAKQAQPGSRAQLMEEAKAKGIKYFRILSKTDLSKVLEMKKGGASDEQINVITEVAKIRWQAGWSKNKEDKNA